MERIFGLLLSGFAMRIYGAIAAIWIAMEVSSIMVASLESVTHAF
jgi:hypothetical protein